MWHKIGSSKKSSRSHWHSPAHMCDEGALQHWTLAITYWMSLPWQQCTPLQVELFTCQPPIVSYTSVMLFIYHYRTAYTHCSQCICIQAAWLTVCYYTAGKGFECPTSVFQAAGSNTEKYIRIIAQHRHVSLINPLIPEVMRSCDMGSEQALLLENQLWGAERNCTEWHHCECCTVMVFAFIWKTRVVGGK